jgi:Tol biopolymer transport system component
MKPAFMVILILLQVSLYVGSSDGRETSHFIIRSQEGNEIFADELAGLAESIYDDTTRSVGYIPDKKVKVTLYPTKRTFSITAYVGGGLVLIYGCPFSTESGGADYLDRKRQIAHEFIHYLLFEKVEELGDPLAIRDIIWISEGPAMYFSGGEYNRLRSKAAVNYLVETDEVPPLKEMYEHPFAGFLSYSVVSFMVEEYGKESFCAFLDELAVWDDTQPSIANVDRALQKSVGVTLQEFEEAWMSYVDEFVKDVKEEDFCGTRITDSGGCKIASSWYDGKILFVSDVDRDLNIYVTDEDGTTEERLTSDLSADFDPKFSPDGTKIAFTSRRDGFYNIYVMDADGSHVTQVTTGKSLDVMGSWSSDGKILFTSSRDGNYNIYVMDADGSNVVQLTDDPKNEGWPHGSPDGGKIVFVSDRNGTYDVYTMDADGKNVQQLTNTPEYENYPQYSPDGKRIVFISKGEKGSVLCIMDSDGKTKKEVAPQPWVVDGLVVGSYGVPVWSPDGKRVAVTCGAQLFLIDIPDSLGAVWIILVTGFIIGGAVIYLKLRE